MEYITHFHTINAHLSVSTSYLISQYKVMDHLKFLSVCSVGCSIIMKDDCTFNQFWILLQMHHRRGTADITCIAIHSLLKLVVEYHTQEHYAKMAISFVSDMFCQTMYFMVTVDEATEKTVIGIFQFTHTLAHISMIVIILFNTLFPW